MNCQEIIEKLQSVSSEKYKANVVKMGIPEKCSIGVPTSEVRSLAKEIGKSNELAFELWKTGYHEAKLLALLLLDKKQISHEDIEYLMDGVFSWDLCDHLCKNLIIKTKDYDSFIMEWSRTTEVYRIRAAFTLASSAAIHNDKITDEKINEYLELIRECSNNLHEHVKKAGNKTQMWIAKDVLREIENVVKAAGRKRLISANTKMGQEV